MSALLGELRGLDKAGSSLASRRPEYGASPETHYARNPADQHFRRPGSRLAPVRGSRIPTPVTWLTSPFAPVGTRHCLVSGCACTGAAPGRPDTVGDMGVELGF